ncbi:hypothetical protein IW152_004520 [Coemansia sp. BCRC 34962]|nr:hypothetical protein IW152_004520 [Coemansia sp. BCRC 34962]
MASQIMFRCSALSTARAGRAHLTDRLWLGMQHTSTLRQWYTAPVHKLDKYSPEIVESDWYSWWQQRGLFDPKRVDGASKADKFSMLLPPPNITGVLHIGHALTLSIQDSIARWNRMHGRSVNWVPGTDHAGISMQTVVEKKLERETGKTRHDLGRHAFINKVWEWKKEHGDRIKQQTKSLGASLNWGQEYFTMDPLHSQLVRDAFIRLYDDGLIYRSTKMVSWSCALQSVISDIEVDKIPTEGRTLIEIPQRLDHYHLVNPEFGTGVITPAHDENDYACAQRHGLPVVTVFGPAGTVVDNSRFSGFVGKSRWETRQKVISDLKVANAYFGSRDAESSVVSRCSRSGDIIEPMLMPQWYLRCSEMAKAANGLVQQGCINLLPRRQQATWHSWLAETEDWCVSRQLWWGHRIPIYHVHWEGIEIADSWVAATSEEHARAKAHNELSTEEKAILASVKRASAVCTVKQDDDVLDTWFSSGLLPLLAFKKSSLDPGPCAQSPGKAALSTVLETGQDILFFWVARMTMLCTYFAQVPPFSTVLLHPMVRDAQGRKMSKSLGNVIDPMDVINGAELSKLQDTLRRGYLSDKELKRGTKELAKMYPSGFQQFGADALRFALLLYTQQTQQINMSLDGVRASYHFCNKLWNTFRFIHMHAAKLDVDTDHVDQNGNKQWLADIDDRELTVFDRALLSRLYGMLHTYHSAMGAYRLAAAAEAVREFVQRDLCDRYIEICKLSLFGNPSATNQVPTVAVKVLLGSLDIVLRALHPFMPFLSEELWQRHARSCADGDMSVMEAKWATLSEILRPSCSAEAENNLVLDIVSSIRSIRQQHQGRLAAANASEPIFSVVISATELSTFADDSDMANQQLVHTARTHEACIELMSKESAICIRTGERSSTMAIPDSGDNVVAIVVSPQVRVEARLTGETAARPTHAAGARISTSMAAMAKLESELEKVRSVIGSAGYQRSAPDIVKVADR